MTTGKALREGSARKRAAILSAARELFIADGFDRTSVDAIAASAAVSKRTVYDYFGDKQALLVAVIEQTAQALMLAVHNAIDENLTDVENLETSLLAFAHSITTSALGSPDYTALIRLVSMESVNLDELREHLSLNAEPEDALAERFIELGRRGLLDVPKPRRAADHFVALTLSAVAQSNGHGINPGASETDEIIADGVGAFVRAYGAGSGADKT